MADKRRLQLDIDRTLKKINEGRQIFQETVAKLEQAVTQTQKEKFESDLKKEIKKLQRFRDQIKTWLQCNDVKDKALLQDYRRDIESDMERFKIIEKETKTKAYSKEGLVLELKKDPIQKEKEDFEDWLKDIISKLTIHTEKLEFDIEKIIQTTTSMSTSLNNNNNNSSKKKRGNNNNNDKESLATIELKKAKLVKIRGHINACEACMRSLNNDNLDLDLLKEDKEKIELFAMNPDLELDLQIYDDFIIDHTLLECENGFNLSSPLAAANSNFLDEINESASSTLVVNSIQTQQQQRDDFIKIDEKQQQSLAAMIMNNNELLSHKQQSSSTVSVVMPLFPSGLLAESINTNTVNNNTNKSSTQSSTLSTTMTPSTTTTTATASNLNLLSSNQPLNSPTPSPPQSGSSNNNDFCKDSFISLTPATITATVAPITTTTLSSSTTSAAPLLMATNRSSSQYNYNYSPVPPATTSTTAAQSQQQQQQIILSSNHEKSHFNRLFNRAMSLELTQTTQQPQRSDGGGILLSPQAPTTSSFYNNHNSNGVVDYANTSNNNEQPQQHHHFLAQLSDPRSFTNFVDSSPIVVNNNYFLNSNNTVSSSASLHSAINNDIIASSSLAVGGQESSSSLSMNPHYHQHHLQNKWRTTGSIKPHTLSSNSPSSSSTAITSGGGGGDYATIHLTTEQVYSPFSSNNNNNQNNSNEQLDDLERLLNIGYRRAATPEDSNRARMTLLKLPPPYETRYPKEPLIGSHTEEYYSKLDNETLFFIFYYFSGTRAQYLASRALKRKSWRFHKLQQLWFQRFEEPKSIGDEYESGAYIYWDVFTKTPQKYDDFKFEYRYLEDFELT